MIGRFIDQQEMSVVQEKRSKQDLGLFSVRQRRERPPEDIFPDFQIRQFSLQLPLFCHRTNFRQDILCQPVFIVNRIRKIIKLYRSLDLPTILVLPEQQVQKRRFSPAVPSDKSEFPVCIDLEADIFKNIFRTGRVRKSKVLNPDH